MLQISYKTHVLSSDITKFTQLINSTNIKQKIVVSSKIHNSLGFLGKLISFLLLFCGR